MEQAGTSRRGEGGKKGREGRKKGGKVVVTFFEFWRESLLRGGAAQTFSLFFLILTTIGLDEIKASSVYQSTWLLVEKIGKKTAFSLI